MVVRGASLAGSIQSPSSVTGLWIGMRFLLFSLGEKCRRVKCPLFLLRIRGGATVTTSITTACGLEPLFWIQPVRAAGFGIGGCTLLRAMEAPFPTVALPQLWMKRRGLLRRAGTQVMPRIGCAARGHDPRSREPGEGSMLNGRSVGVTTQSYLVPVSGPLVAFVRRGVAQPLIAACSPISPK